MQEWRIEVAVFLRKLTTKKGKSPALTSGTFKFYE